MRSFVSLPTFALGLSLVVIGCERSSSTTDGDGELDDSAACEALTDEAACTSATDEAECVWYPASRATRTGDTCEVTETGVCFASGVLDGLAGCSPTYGCDGLATVPYYREEPGGTVLLVDFCGGTPPDSVTMCSSGLAEVDPPECACVCELAPEG